MFAYKNRIMTSHKKKHIVRQDCVRYACLRQSKPIEYRNYCCMITRIRDAVIVIRCGVAS